MQKVLIFTILTLFSTVSYAQLLSGTVSDDSKETLIGVLVESSNGEKARTDVEGKFVLQAKTYPLTLTFKYIDYLDYTISLREAPGVPLNVVMTPKAQQMEGVVISASRREQKVEDVPISLEIIKPKMIENKGLTSIDAAVNQAPGVFTMDGQTVIRGGGGFSYGAGSRVQVVWNDVPILSADAGDVKWESIGLENVGQVEILKGASSVLYGSGALNGIVSIKDKAPSKEGETKASYQIGIYDRPKRQGLRWTNRTLMSHQLTAYNSKMYKNFGYTVSANGYRSDGYRQGEDATKGRLNTSLFFHPQNLRGLKAGVNFSMTMERKGSFLIWESDSLGYSPRGGYIDPYADSSSISLLETLRIMVDPYLNYFDKFNNKHSLKSRYYNTTNKNIGANNFGAKGEIYFVDYKYERKFRWDWLLIAGLTGNWGVINADLYGNHHSKNYSLYGQLEKSFGNLDLIGGVRGEYYQVNDLTPDSKAYFNKDSTASMPIRPIFRAAAHYKIGQATHLRASVGQAYRFPSIAERFASTSVGALNIFPNPELKPENGWSTEVGIKQGFKIGSFKGFADLSGFYSEYRNMMEFTFGFYPYEGAHITLGNLKDFFGFRAENAEQARVYGAELSVNGTGNIGEVLLTALMGYTYMNPVIVNPDSSYIYGKNGNGGVSDPSTSMLKYRFHHLVKADVELEYKKIMLGFSTRYNSFMKNIDRTFEEGVKIVVNGLVLAEEQIVKGLKEYRDEHNKGDIVFDARVGYRFTDKIQMHFIVDNIMNNEYMTRPADIRPPRQFILRLQANI